MRSPTSSQPDEGDNLASPRLHSEQDVGYPADGDTLVEAPQDATLPDAHQTEGGGG